jgi:hypothetical protein
MISNLLPFVLRLSKDERRVFQQNQNIGLDPNFTSPLPVASWLSPT